MLSRQKVLTTALGLIDEQGLDGLSLRALARRLQVSFISLCNHVASKDHPLHIIHEAPLAETIRTLGGSAASWQVRL
ncbi:TetR/AcrR family transcriptional regulator [Actinopolymorpha pittospori]|uniref:AcrR family transcriptional regulator n=1 Tax=Actinopolymorpha pittospori TaxID=648752 RepID=A0A927MRR9_9ACTN|nr:TetR family transcriptional regulator [Actinopolymorpha pittospori]MBE1604028.1 AcrR family transcriptional regulator [Actinopolymorpha pittospori]